MEHQHSTPKDGHDDQRSPLGRAEPSPISDVVVALDTRQHQIATPANKTVDTLLERIRTGDRGRQCHCAFYKRGEYLAWLGSWQTHEGI